MKTESVEIAGKTYEVKELGIQGNPAWRRQLQEALAPVLDVAGRSTQLEIGANQAGDVMAIIREVSELLITAPAEVAALIFAYSPEIAADRDYILENAYESEIMGAFVQILRLAFPFGRLLSVIGPTLNGSMIPTGPQTAPSLQSQNGAPRSGKSTKSRKRG